MSAATRVRAVISGVVQGVGFRYFAVREARARGLSGWVQNKPDGSVEVLVEGGKGLVMDFVKQLRLGPPGSRVTGVQVQSEHVDGELDSFVVRY